MPYSKAQKLRRKLNKSPVCRFLDLIGKEMRQMQRRNDTPPNGRKALIAARKARRSDPNAYGTNGRPAHLRED